MPSTLVYLVPTDVPWLCNRCKKTGVYKTKIHWLDLDFKMHRCGGTLKLQSPQRADIKIIRDETYSA